MNNGLWSSRPKVILNEVMSPGARVSRPKELSHPKVLPLNDVMASLLHIYRACFVSLVWNALNVIRRGYETDEISEYSLIKALKVEKNEMYYAFFRVVSFHQCFINEVYYTYIPCFVSSSFKERDILEVYPACFVSFSLKEQTYCIHPLLEFRAT